MSALIAPSARGQSSLRKPVLHPALCYCGGRFSIGKWIIRHFPSHYTYVEPFGGGASVLLQKRPAPCEIYNDLDSEIVNFFRVLQDAEQRKTLITRLSLTPHSREEYTQASRVDDEEPVTRACALFIRSWQGIGPAATRKHRSAWSVSTTTSSLSKSLNAIENLPAVVERLRCVHLEHRPAIDLIKRHDNPETLLYVDPPYLFSTRSGDSHASHDNYRHEMDDEAHMELLALLKKSKSMIVLSGYPSTLYDSTLARWRRQEKSTYTDGAGMKKKKPVTEVIWMNPAVSDRIQMRLF